MFRLIKLLVTEHNFRHFKCLHFFVKLRIIVLIERSMHSPRYKIIERNLSIGPLSNDWEFQKIIFVISSIKLCELLYCISFEYFTRNYHWINANDKSISCHIQMCMEHCKFWNHIFNHISFASFALSFAVDTNVRCFQ